jgi:RND family efflux transporter MFP subunit
MRSSRTLAPVLVLLAGAGGAWVLVATRPQAEAKRPPVEPPPVRVVEAVPADVELRVRSQGTVVPWAQSQLVAEVAGRVVWVSPNLASGAFFSAGEPLLRLEAFDYAAAVDAAEADRLLRESRGEHAAAELRRFEALHQKGIVSRAEVERAAAAAKGAAASLRAAAAALTRARRELERTTVIAPYDGRVRAENVDVGQFLARGTVVGTVYAVDRVEVRLPVRDEDLAHLDLPLTPAAGELPGPEVRLRARFGGGDRIWVGRAVRTEGEIDPRTRVVHVIARVDDPFGGQGPAPLTVGMFVEAEIIGRHRAGIIRLPRSALRPDSQVFVVDAGDRLQARPVELIGSPDYDEILVAHGLEGGERVALSLGPGFVQGTAVRALPADLAERAR